MNAKRRSLGKGLDALLSTGRDTQTPTSNDGLMDMPIELLQPGKYQPRTEMDSDKLEELADSIRAQGIVQPIVVRPIGGRQHEIIAGERRWRAAQLAGLDAVPVIVREVDDNTTIAIALIENIQRENLNPLEESTALQRLISEFELTHQEAADAVGRSRASVSNMLRLQDLEEDVKKLVNAGQIEMGHARALLGLSGNEQSHAARVVVTRSLSVRETEKLVQGWDGGKKTNSAARQTKKDPDITRLENELTEKLGARVLIKHASNGKGQLIIQYSGAEELEGILDRIE